MVMPKIEREAEARNYGKFVISPLERGFGAVLGNALRRVLLTSLDGAAVTSIQFADLLNEFSEIRGVREDVIQITLQIRQLRIKLNNVDKAQMYLEVRGEGTVTAADISNPAQVEIVNPELYLFSVDDPKTKFDIRITVERGRGYSLANERAGSLPLGELPVDAIFNPVKRINWEVASVRVGPNTYDKLIFEIWTDGTTSPERALSKSSHILIDHLNYVAGINKEMRTGAM